jgi:hypothetical protein
VTDSLPSFLTSVAVVGAPPRKRSGLPGTRHVVCWDDVSFESLATLTLSSVSGIPFGGLFGHLHGTDGTMAAYASFRSDQAHPQSRYTKSITASAHNTKGTYRCRSRCATSEPKRPTPSL